MSSQAQINANRANAQQSTGPRTETGKAITSQNARRHGVYSRYIEFNSEEERDHYDEILDGLLDAWNPANGGETAALYTMARARFWRLRLELAVEREWNNTLARGGDQALADPDGRKESQLGRRLRSVKTDYNQALAELKHLQRQRQLREAAEAKAAAAARPAEASRSQSATLPTQPSEPEIGFVPAETPTTPSNPNSEMP